MAAEKYPNAYLEGREEKKVADIEVGSVDGLWTWRFKYEDGSVGPEERTGISVAKKQAMDTLVSDMKRKHGIE